MEPTKHKWSGQFGDLDIKMEGERYSPQPILDTKVEITGGTICWITWENKENFIRELNEVIWKYRI